MRSRVNLRSDITIIVILILLFLMIFFLGEIQSASGLATFFGIFAVIVITRIGVGETLSRIAKRIRLRKATKEELRREDDFLLQATGFSQAGLFIYLNLVETNETITILKILIPFLATVFLSYVE